MIKKGSHLDGVEPINEKIINNRNLYDKSGNSGNSVLLARKDKFNNDEFVFPGVILNEFISNNNSEMPVVDYVKEVIKIYNKKINYKIIYL